MIILRVLLETFGNLISTVMTSNYHYYIGKILNNFENIYRNCNIVNNYIFKYSIKVFFLKYIYIAKITKIFKQTIMCNINKSQYLVKPSLTLIICFKVTVHTVY